MNLNLNEYVEVSRPLVLYDVGGCANYLDIAVLNELTDAEWTMLSGWFHPTTVLEKKDFKEFQNCSVLHG